jgi:hypothetical protein
MLHQLDTAFEIKWTKVSPAKEKVALYQYCGNLCGGLLCARNRHCLVGGFKPELYHIQIFARRLFIISNSLWSYR